MYKKSKAGKWDPIQRKYANYISSTHFYRICSSRLICVCVLSICFSRKQCNNPFIVAWEMFHEDLRQTLIRRLM